MIRAGESPATAAEDRDVAVGHLAPVQGSRRVHLYRVLLQRATCLGLVGVPRRGRAVSTHESVVGTFIGTYPPFVYVPAGLLAHVAKNPQTRLWLGRAGMAAIALLMLIAAMLVLWDPETGGLSLIGLVVAATPMVLFVSSTLSASGPEVASAICFIAALLRLSRSKPPSWRVWATLAVSGIVLAISRELGPEFIVIEIAGTSLVLGWRHLRSLVPGRRAAWVWAPVAAACVLGVAWDMLYNVHPPTGGR